MGLGRRRRSQQAELFVPSDQLPRRRDSGEDWRAYVVQLIQAEEIVEDGADPTDEEVRRFDQQWKNKKVPNDEWVSATDPDARIAKMKDGRTRLAYSAEHVVDVESELILAAEAYLADEADAQTLTDSVMQAVEHVQRAGGDQEIEEVAADKDYYAAEQLELLEFCNFHTYIPEPRRRGKSRLSKRPIAQQRAVKAKRRRAKTDKGRRLR